MPRRNRRRNDADQPAPVAGQVVVDDGARPVTDDGGRPVTHDDATPATVDAEQPKG